MDAKSLYTNILNHQGIEAEKEKLNAQTDKPIAAKVIIKFLFLILTLNNFIFNSISYLQINGCSWEPSVHHHHMRTFLWESLNRHISIRI